MLTTQAVAAYVVVDPGMLDTRRIAGEARDLGCAVAAHPRTIAAMHAAYCVYGPLIQRTTLEAALGVEVVPDDTIPEPLVLLVPSV